MRTRAVISDEDDANPNMAPTWHRVRFPFVMPSSKDVSASTFMAADEEVAEPERMYLEYELLVPEVRARMRVLKLLFGESHVQPSLMNKLSTS
jgi:hypothetical protein